MSMYSTKASHLLSVLALSWLTSCLAAPAHAGVMVPLKGSFDGQIVNLENDSIFYGNFTHLGRFDGTSDGASATAQWTAANGDTVTNQTTSFVLEEEISPNVFTYVQMLVITGGTGRFENAGGSAVVEGTIDFATGEFDGFLKGTITRPNSQR